MSAVQFNLLPPSKMQAQKSQAQQAVYTGKAVRVMLVSILLLALTSGYNLAGQQIELANIKSKLKTKTTQLQQTKNLNAILTVQNQLQTVASLHASQHVSSRIFDYLAKLVPQNASVGAVNLDLVAGTIKIDGTADSATTTNGFIDALKTAQFQSGNASSTSAFSQVIESSFTLSNQGVSFSLDAKFNPVLFTSTSPSASGQVQVPNLSVPSSTTVHSNDPGSLFGGTQ